MCVCALSCVTTDKGPDPEQVSLGPAGGVCVLDFTQERFQITSPGTFESMFIKAGDRETRKDLG